MIIALESFFYSEGVKHFITDLIEVSPDEATRLLQTGDTSGYIDPTCVVRVSLARFCASDFT